jgi:hypothetical protein
MTGISKIAKAKMSSSRSGTRVEPSFLRFAMFHSGSSLLGTSFGTERVEVTGTHSARFPEFRKKRSGSAGMHALEQGGRLSPIRGGIAKMDRKLWLLAVCVVGLMFVAVGQKSSSKVETAAGVPRYQLVAARMTEENGTVTESALLIDTQRGRVWRYQAAGEAHPPGGKVSAYPDAFAPVGIGRPVVDVSGNGLKDAAEDDPSGH